MTSNIPCAGCGLRFQCVCDSIPSFNIDAHIALLMHENELRRDTNTGQWLLKSIPSTSQHIWQRTQPCEKLLTMIADARYQVYLLFPNESSIPLPQATQAAAHSGKTPLFIVLDGTWQEAKKMLNKSPWLKALECVHLAPTEESQYQLRRNQQQGHLCTLEVGSAIVEELGYSENAQHLSQFFTHYMAAFKADKSGHTL
ncbi:tRNA-uridine aminocarboxypropyltransferase [Vibrio sp. LaRot3]|uniref:tRNA-uridine aminocarboxypropyltransferase n=1 Tax=Vibrio sp. LaRot3 TaxID=2998829 RepID=UPI0022CDBD8E|nr:DTW domain-containing protein [Vibrio sp. LaRot3]MDA0150329.1 DTW domain-containing protein [Vibrio sp. LaRot3]